MKYRKTISNGVQFYFIHFSRSHCQPACRSASLTQRMALCTLILYFSSFRMRNFSTGSTVGNGQTVPTTHSQSNGAHWLKYWSIKLSIHILLCGERELCVPTDVYISRIVQNLYRFDRAPEPEHSSPSPIPRLCIALFLWHFIYFIYLILLLCCVFWLLFCVLSLVECFLCLVY